jgi:hypothetical protein
MIGRVLRRVSVFKLQSVQFSPASFRGRLSLDVAAAATMTTTTAMTATTATTATTTTTVATAAAAAVAAVATMMAAAATTAAPASDVVNADGVRVTASPSPRSTDSAAARSVFQSPQHGAAHRFSKKRHLLVMFWFAFLIYAIHIILFA